MVVGPWAETVEKAPCHVKVFYFHLFTVINLFSINCPFTKVSSISSIQNIMAPKEEKPLLADKAALNVRKVIPICIKLLFFNQQQKSKLNQTQAETHYYLMSMDPNCHVKFTNIKSDSANHELRRASRTTTLSSGIPVSVSIKNATFGVKRAFLQEYVHNPSRYSCSNFPSFHGSPWRGRGRDTRRGVGEGEGV